MENNKNNQRWTFNDTPYPISLWEIDRKSQLWISIKDNESAQKELAELLNSLVEKIKKNNEK